MRLGRPLLRTADGHHLDERRASWLELFYDLSFAGAVGQLAGALQSHPGLGALARFAMLFAPTWWLWVQLTFYADRHESDNAAHRVSFLAAILLCVGLAASAPRALAGSTTGFVIAFVGLRGLQLLLYARARHHLPATRPLYNCYLICFGAGGALWLASLAVGGAVRYVFWGTALVVDAAGSLAMLAPRRQVPLNTAHLADRFQIFVLIVLGESMARLISAAAVRPWSLPLAVVLAAALITLAALWWAWLTTADRGALDSQPAIARFTALNLPIVAGIAAASAGLHIAILAADGGSAIPAGPRAALYGGVSVCLLASAVLPSTKVSRPTRVARLAAALAAMGLVFMGAIVEPVYLVPALAIVLAIALVTEARLKASAHGGVASADSQPIARQPARPARMAESAGNHTPRLNGAPMPAVLASPATTMITCGDPGRDDARQEPTLTSVWRAVAGTTITDELLEWPADLFTLTEVILQRSQAYRFALSPPAGSTWPPAGLQDWPDAVSDAARRWCAWAEHRNGPVPDLLAQEWGVLQARAGTPFSQLAEARDWRLCEALLTLHAIADEACAGLGVALDAARADGLVYRARGRELLARTGSLARFPVNLIRVLPKVGTPLAGSSLRALSHYAAVQAPGVEVRWHRVPGRCQGARSHGKAVNYLLLPWPLRVRRSDFRPVPGPLRALANDPFGFFEFAPSEPLDLDLVDRTLTAARAEAETVDVVILPESAVEHDEIDGLEALLGRHGVTGLITGVRERPPQPGQFPGNWVHIGVSTGGRWVHIRQPKHHRWSLDDSQIRQYHLAGALHPHVRWWEAMEVPGRSVQFVELCDGVTLASLVCEDLAQTDEVASVIRSVGPTIVVVPLLDGPQLSTRWGARHASVLADDPGSAVLTLTSFGMAHRSWLPGQNPSPVVALWKGPGQQTREISLQPGAQGILLSAVISRATRRSFDGRRPADSGIEFSDVTIRQVRGTDASTRTPQSLAGSPSRPMLAADELTILASWAEAAAEALAFAPEHVEAVTADAQAGAPWRAGLRICEPSWRLSQALGDISQAARTAAVAGGDRLAEAVAVAVRESQPAQPATDRLARAALRSALEQRQTRQPVAGGRPARSVPLPTPGPRPTATGTALPATG